MKSSEIRASFLRYFEERDHAVVSSSSLVPAEDPSLLFANAGMNQFKSVFLGTEKREYRKAASSQKCLRAGGKHNDLENVGKTNRHLTFFEMLGNFSFGDYFKDEAILFGWEFLTVTLALPVKSLWVTVFEQDDEAFGIWKKITGFSEDRIFRLGEKDNFWSMGETGPCGPCSEIGIDMGESFSCGKPDCTVGCDCDRYLELWNLVFMQYNRDSSGKLEPLPKPSIDTGMGLERIASVIQQVPSNFEIDIMKPVISSTEKLSGKSYQDNKVSFRVIADHSRALTFALTDGVMPSNEGRGYVLRRILRRAARHGRLLGLEESFLHTLVDDVVETMSDHYRELLERRDHVKTIVKAEEERFQETLTLGIDLFDSVAGDVLARGEHVIPGEKAFELYDTYGFPLDLTMVMAEEKGMGVDLGGFDKALAGQRQKGRAARAVQTVSEAVELPSSEFVGYDDLFAETTVQFLEVNGEVADEAGEGSKVQVVIDPTPFYGEAGGQLGDSGTLTGEGLEVSVENTFKSGSGAVVLEASVIKGTLSRGQGVNARVDSAKRSALERAHTATHLLHAALRDIIGSHVQQSGSLVAPDRLRFDFTHYDSLSRETITEVEGRVNRWIRQNHEVEWVYTGLDEAKEMGALAFFGEKYGDIVRAVTIGEISLELCGGTHVSSTGEIGSFHILSESSIALGVRRIEAITGRGVLTHLNRLGRIVSDLSDMLKAGDEDITKKVSALLEENRNLKRELKDINKEAALRDVSGFTGDVVDVDGVRVLTRKIDVADMESLREVADHLRSKIGSGVIVLAAESEGKAVFVAAVTDDLVEERGISAGAIIKEVSTIAGGGGGGKPRMAQAGGKHPEKIDEALSAASGIVRQLLGKG